MVVIFKTFFRTKKTNWNFVSKKYFFPFKYKIEKKQDSEDEEEDDDDMMVSRKKIEEPVDPIARKL